jgi:hypothetical protein
MESKLETENYVYYLLYKEPVVAKKHSVRVRLETSDHIEMRNVGI